MIPIEPVLVEAYLVTVDGLSTALVWRPYWRGPDGGWWGGWKCNSRFCSDHPTDCPHITEVTNQLASAHVAVKLARTGDQYL